MQFSPTPNEYENSHSMTESELLEYFVSRTSEAEEVWGLGDDSGWVIREEGDVISLPVWPYQKFALACAVNDWETQVTNAVSLEHFIFNILKQLIDANIQVEIMPSESRQGKLIDPASLFTLFESVIESGEYYIEG